MRNRILAVCLIGLSAIGADIDYAVRVRCDLQLNTTNSLPDLQFDQGTTPLISADQYRDGKAVNADTNVNAVFVFTPAFTSGYGVVTTNYSTFKNSYLIQLPSIGTNASNWQYTIYLKRGNATYWTGRGRLDIAPNSILGNSLVWQQIEGCITQADVDSAIATHNTNLTSHATLFSEKVSTNDSTYLTAVLQASTAIQFESDPSVSPTVNIHNTNLTSHSDSMALKVDRTDTNGWTVSSHDGFALSADLTNYLQLAGGTMTGTFYNDNGGTKLSIFGQDINAVTSEGGTPLPIQLSSTGGGVVIGGTSNDGNQLQVIGSVSITETAKVSYVQATTSEGGTLNSLSGAECLRWGVGSSCAISTTDGLSVGGALNITGIATFSSNVYSTVSQVGQSPAGNELARVDWVRSLFTSGHFFYTSTNVTASGYSANDNFLYQETIPPAFSRTYTGVTNNQYVGMVWTPFAITNPRSPIVITAYLGRSGGSALNVKPEIYFTTDKTNTIYETNGVQAQNISTGNNPYSWVITFPDYDGTVYLGRRFKVISQTGTPNFIVYGGTNQASTISIPANDVNATTPNHNDLSGRTATDAHPTNAITGLSEHISRAVTNGQSGAFTVGSISHLANGNVGIGQVNPSAKLEVAGNVWLHSGTVFLDYIKGYSGNQWYLGDENGNFAFNLRNGSFSFTEGEVSMTSNLTVLGVSKIILPTSTNGLASGMLWNNSGTISIMP